MLLRIYIENFKRFTSYQVSLRQRNILVGPNNSGKSSILDLIRVLWSCLRIARSRNPQLLSEPEFGIVPGHDLSAEQIPIPLANATHDYSIDDAVIDFYHRNGARIRLILNPQGRSRFFLLHEGPLPRTATAFSRCFPLTVIAIPTLAPFEEEEAYVTDLTVTKNRATRLASRTFRNIWLRARTEEFEEFRLLVEASWANTSIKMPENRGFGEPLRMFYSEERLDREVYWAGFGFQAWLQILTHILRTPNDALFLMDEVDVYLHPDLQKRLLRIIDGRFSQVVIATHSTEIINDAEIGSIVSINPLKASGRRISTDQEYQAVYDYIGAAENAELAKLGRAKRIIFFEGDDRRIMQWFAAKLGFERLSRNTDVPIIPVGGFSRWRRVEEAAWTLRTILQIDASIFSLFDRDYRTNSEIESIRAGLGKAGIDCRIWKRKEIENYTLSLPVIIRLIKKHCPENERDACDAEIENFLWSTTDAYAKYTLEQLLENELRACHDKASAEAECRARFESQWSRLEGRFALGPGKKIVRELSGWSKERYGVSVTLSRLISEFRPREIDVDMQEVLAALNAFCTDEVSKTLDLLR